ncbi:MAG: putative quinol monooxygenase [Verrucomicrobium sp.]
MSSLWAAKALLPVSQRTFTLLTALLFLGSPCAKAQSSEDPKERPGHKPHPAGEAGKVVATLTQLQVKQPHQAQVKDATKNYVMHALGSEGNIMAEAYYEEADSTVLWLIERWASKEALDRISSSSESKILAALAKEALVKPVEITPLVDLEPLSKQEWRRAAKSEDRPLTIMLFVDAKPGTQGDFKEIYHKAMPPFRSQPGVVTYQISQLKEDGTKFVTYEKFRSKDAFQAHLVFPAIKPVIDFLHTSIKKQPFQEGLHTLIEFAPPYEGDRE